MGWVYKGLLQLCRADFEKKTPEQSDMIWRKPVPNHPHGREPGKSLICYAKPSYFFGSK